MRGRSGTAGADEDDHRRSASQDAASVAEVEEPLERLEEAVGRSGAALGPQARQRRVEQFRGVALEGLADLAPLRLAELRQPAEQAVELRLARLAPAGLELFDHRRERAVVEVAHEPYRLGGPLSRLALADH